MKIKQKIVLLLCTQALLYGCAKTEKEPVQEAFVTQKVAENKSEMGTEFVSEAEAGKDTEGTESPTEAVETETQEVAQELTLLMTGDILLHDRVEECARQTDGSYDFTAIFSQTEETIRAADLAMVNQEVIIGGEELGVSGYPAFNAPYAIGDALVNTGFDVICHATNHALDKGKNGILNCTGFWKTKYPQIGVVGIYETEEESNELYFYEQNGMKIAILNYTYGTNGISLPANMPYAVDLLEEEKVIADIRRAEAEADFTVVCPHWGIEYQLEPSGEQERWAELFLREGVDLVFGTHPHVMEPVEWMEDEETGNKMLVYYSLGNFVNWTSESGAGIANRMVGGMAEVTLERESQTSPVVIKEYGVEAVVSHVEYGTNKICVYPLSQYTQELAQKNEIVSQDANFSYEYCVDLCNRVWNDLWK